MSLIEQLVELGITEAQAKSVEGLFKQYIAGEYIPKHRFDEVNGKNKDLAIELARAEAEKSEFEKRAKKAEESVNPLQEQLKKVQEDWQKKYDDREAEYTKKEEERQLYDLYMTKTGAIKTELGDTSYDPDMVISLMDLDSLSVDNGAVSGVKEAIAKMQTEKPYLFKPQQAKSTAPDSAPNSSGAGKSGSTLNFGKALAEQAGKVDALTQAAAEKYFGKL